MNNILLISPDKNLIDEVNKYLYKENNNFSSNLIIFPNRRPAHFLRKYISQNLKASFIPPIIFSIDDFVSYVYGELREFQYYKKLNPIDSVALLYDIHMENPYKMGNDDFLEPDKFFPIGSKIFKDIEELYIENISVERVRQIRSQNSNIIPEKSALVLEHLSYFYEKFYKKLNDLKFSTRASMYHVVSENISNFNTLKSFKKIISVGFFTFTKSEIILFENLLKFESFLFIFEQGDGIKDNISKLNSAIIYKENKDISKEPAIKIFKSPDTHGQVFQLSEILKKIKDKENRLDEKTLIMLPLSSTLLPLIRYGLGFLNTDEYNISMGYPLYRTPIVGFFNSLFDLVNSMDGDYVYLQDYFKFVLHPYTKNINLGKSPEPTRIIFHTIENEFLKHKTRTFLKLEDIEEDNNLLETIFKKVSHIEYITSESIIKNHIKAIHTQTIRNFLKFKNIEDFAKKCLETCVYIFQNSTVKYHSLFYPFSEVFQKHFGTLSKSLIKDIAFEKINAYFNFFKYFIMPCNYPYKGTPVKGLQILGFLETRVLKFDRIFMLDINEGIMPNTTNNSLLPIKSREMLGLTTYRDNNKISEYYFNTLIKGAKEVYIFFIDDEKKEKSRYIEKIIWQKQKSDNTLQEQNEIETIRYKITLKESPIQEIQKTDKIIDFLKTFSYSVTSLDKYLQCPLKFYYSDILLIHSKKELGKDIERIDIGILVHKILKQYFSLLPKHQYLKKYEISLKRMNSTIDEIFKIFYNKELFGASYLLKLQIEKHLRDYLQNYYIPLVENAKIKILDIEKSIRHNVKGLHLTGRPDYIEERNGKITIIDYKTSANKSKLMINFKKLKIDERTLWYKHIGSIQLPFYLILYSEYTKKEPRDIDAMFLTLGKSSIDNNIEVPLFGDNEFEGNFDMIKALIFELLGEIINQDLPFNPTTDKRNCQICDFKWTCRL